LILGGHFDLGAKEKRINELENEMLTPDFWDKGEMAQNIISELNQLKGLVEDVLAIERSLSDVEVLIELAKEEEVSLIDDIVAELNILQKKLADFELKLMLSGPYDKNNAVLELHPGAGGTESQDWAEMLYRMYMRWADRRGFKTEILDYLAGDEAGIKSVTILVKGYNAYGYLQGEKGVHRLIRISPFDASGRRHTSFVSVQVTPEIDDNIEVEIKAEDIKIDTYRSSGAGGQHVNTTDSAVRITHLPTNTVVTCQSERSQIKNREVAMKLLRSRLFQLKLDEQEQELAKIRGEQKEIGWGSQIRTYVFHPYSLVKDHRTQVEIGNIQAVMDGEIDIFIDRYLQMKMSEQKSDN